MTGKGASLQATFGAVNLRKFQASLASLAWWKSRIFNGKIIAHVLFLFVVWSRADRKFGTPFTQVFKPDMGTLPGSSMGSSQMLMPHFFATLQWWESRWTYPCETISLFRWISGFQHVKRPTPSAIFVKIPCCRENPCLLHQGLARRILQHLGRGASSLGPLLWGKCIEMWCHLSLLANRYQIYYDISLLCHVAMPNTSPPVVCRFRRCHWYKCTPPGWTEHQ